MTLCTDDSKTSCCLYLRRELDIGTTTSHVGSDGDSTLTIGALSCESNDVCLLLVQLGIKHLVWDTFSLTSLRVHIHVEHTTQKLRDLH